MKKETKDKLKGWLFDAAVILFGGAVLFYIFFLTKA